MKKTIKLIGIIAFVVVIGLLLAGCGKKGGTITVKNASNASINVLVGFAGSGTATVPSGNGDAIAVNASKDYSTKDDGVYIVQVVGNKSDTGSISGDASINYEWDGTNLTKK